MGDQEHLDFLYLLTVADIRGTSPKVWNAWKGRLLSQLYSETSRALARGVAEPLDVEAHIADLRAAARALLEGQDLYGEHVEHFWETMEAEHYDADSLAWHAAVLASAAASDLPLVAARYAPELGGSEFILYSPDRDDLFAIITGGFDRLNLSIMDARIHTTRGGFALDTFVALDHAGQAVTDTRDLAHLQRELRQQLLNPQPGPDRSSTLLPRQLKHFPIATRVTFTPAPGQPVTIMEVIAQDRPGLLYQVALALKECRVNLMAAKVSTYGERAEDIFFINSRDGSQPITDKAQLACLEQGIARRLTPPSAVPRAVAF
jgi:[protein-PII] uridylyltransferase